MVTDDNKKQFSVAFSIDDAGVVVLAQDWLSRTSRKRLGFMGIWGPRFVTYQTAPVIQRWGCTFSPAAYKDKPTVWQRFVGWLFNIHLFFYYRAVCSAENPADMLWQEKGTSLGSYMKKVTLPFRRLGQRISRALVLRSSAGMRAPDEEAQAYQARLTAARSALTARLANPGGKHPPLQQLLQDVREVLYAEVPAALLDPAHFIYRSLRADRAILEQQYTLIRDTQAFTVSKREAALSQAQRLHTALQNTEAAQDTAIKAELAELHQQLSAYLLLTVDTNTVAVRAEHPLQSPEEAARTAALDWVGLWLDVLCLTKAHAAASPAPKPKESASTAVGASALYQEALRFISSPIEELLHTKRGEASARNEVLDAAVLVDTALRSLMLISYEGESTAGYQRMKDECVARMKALSKAIFLRYHPDRNRDKPIESTALFQQLQADIETLNKFVAQIRGRGHAKENAALEAEINTHYNTIILPRFIALGDAGIAQLQQQQATDRAAAEAREAAAEAREAAAEAREAALRADLPSLIEAGVAAALAARAAANATVPTPVGENRHGFHATGAVNTPKTAKDGVPTARTPSPGPSE